MAHDLEKYANDIRIKLFEVLYRAGGGHYGGTFSCVEILCVLYRRILRVDPHDSRKPDRDRLILSKGHAGPLLYTILSDMGFFPKSWLWELDVGGAHLPKHVDRLKVPGIDFSSGPLGQGFSVAVGMACAAKMDRSNVKVYVVLGDGECDEGQVWEAAMSASHYRLDNLVAVVDYNHCQIDGKISDVMELEPFAQKWEAFGWTVIPVDGHDAAALECAFERAAACERPAVIIADTVKGKGISFMEGQYGWHSGTVTEEQFLLGMAELKRGEPV